MNPTKELPLKGGSALERSKAAARALSVSARKLRLSTSNRSILYQAAGLRPRFIDRLYKFLFVASLAFVVILPNVLSLLYFLAIASDQYVSEARFVVRTSAPAVSEDSFGKATGVPSAKIAQDTQIIVSFIHSRTIIENLDAMLNLRARFSEPGIDFLARADKDASYEELLQYWNSMVTTSVSASSGIVTVELRAFSARDANDILKAVIAESEKTVNQLNDRIWHDVVQGATDDFNRATAKLQDVRQRMASSQNRSGVLTVEGSSNMLSKLISDLEAEKIALEQSYTVKLANVSAEAPQMRVLKRQIDNKDKQIEELRGQLAGVNPGTVPTLADISAERANLEFELQLAEKQFADSTEAYERVQFISQQQLMYLDSFLEPTLPGDAGYPKRAQWILVILGASLMIWGSTIAILKFGRDRLSG